MVYRELKQLLVKTPQKVTHEAVLALFERYHDALPETKEMIPIRLYINKRKESMRQLENQPNYTKLTLLEIASTILDEADSREVDEFINEKFHPMALKEYAQESVQKNYVRNMKLTSKNAEDHVVPLPITNRKRQLMHHYASTGLRLPNDMIVKKTRGSFNGRGNGRGNGKNFGGQNGGRKNNNSGQNGNKNGDGQNGNNSRNGRGGKGGRGGRGGNRGGRAPPGNKENQPPVTNQQQNNDVTTPGSKCESVFKTYDLSKIPAKVAHFGQITPQMHDLLNDQLIQRNIEIKPFEIK